MSFGLYAGNLERFRGLPVHERITQVVCGHLRSGNFGGRVDVAPETFNDLQGILVHYREPTFRLTGEPDTGDYRIELVIAGATVRVHVDTTLDNYDMKVYLRDA